MSTFLSLPFSILINSSLSISNDLEIESTKIKKCQNGVDKLTLGSMIEPNLHNLNYYNSSSAKTVECKVVGLEGVSYQNINNQVTYRPSARLPWS